MTFQPHAVFVTLAAPDLETLVQFYRQLLGREPASYRPHAYAEFHLPELRLGLFQPQASQQAEFLNQGGCSLSLCLRVCDLEAAIRHLARLGYPPPGEMQVASHGREIYAYDPIGNRLILYQEHGSTERLE